MSAGHDEGIRKKFNLLVENLQKHYGLSFDEILDCYKDKIEGLRFEMFNETPQKKYIGIVD